MRTRGMTQKCYHLKDNLFVRGIRSGYDDYEKTMELYEVKNFREKDPKYKEILIEYYTGFSSNYDMIPIDIIDNFEGFDEDDMPKESGWFLAICAQSQFSNRKPHLDPDCHSTSYSGPNTEWFKSSAEYWTKNETNKGILSWLVQSYVMWYYSPDYMRI